MHFNYKVLNINKSRHLIAFNLECFPLRENMTHNGELQSENSHGLSVRACNNFMFVTCTRVGLTSQ